MKAKDSFIAAPAEPAQAMSKPRVFQGWTMVAATHVLFALVFGAVYSFGAFFEHMQATLSTGRFAVSTIFSTTAFVYYALGLVAGALADRFSARLIVGCGIVLLALGFALASLASSLPMLLLVFCSLVGLGVGLVYVPAIAVVQRWFVRRRSRASGLALAGTGVGTFIGPMMATLLMQHLSWQNTMQCFAAAIAVLGIGAAWLIIGRPEDLGLLPDGDPPRSATASHLPSPSPRALPSGMGLSQALASSQFWWYFAAILLASVGLFVALVHISPYARALGVSPTHSSLLIGLIGVGNVAGRLVLGDLGDRIGPQRLLIGLTLGLAVLNCVWLQAGNFWTLAAFALLFGAANGGCIALYPSIAAAWFGTGSLGTVLGALYLGVGIAALIGASAAGLLFDLFQSYASTIVASSILAVLSAACLARASQRAVQYLERTPEKPIA